MKTYKYDLLKMRHARLVAECAKDAQAIEAEIESAFSSANGGELSRMAPEGGTTT